MAIILPKITLPKIFHKKRGSGKVFRVFKRLDDGRLLVAGKVDRYRSYNSPSQK